MKIGIIGCGNMGGALLAAFRKQTEHTVVAFDRSREKVDAYGSGVYQELPALLAEADIIVVAVKPQIFAEVAAEIGTAAHGKLVISIMAGVSAARIREALGVEKVIRCMPNMPATLGVGVLGWCAQNVSDAEKNIVDGLFRLAGESVELRSEELVDQITLISGCGPAYVALFAEILEREAVRLGFETPVAERIVAGTLQGAVRVLASGVSPLELRQRVTSKGGITEAVIANLEQNHFVDVFSAGVDAGAVRMEELGKK